MVKAKLVYAVFKEGIYRHECGGIFTTLTKAVKTARELIQKERDDYHDFTVVPFILGQSTNLEEQEQIVRLERQGKVVHEHWTEQS